MRYAVAVLLRPSIRVATVKNARTYLALAGRLDGRVKPAFRHFVSGGQAYNIKSTNEWWQWCIDLLMHSSNAVVMDISRVSTGSAWEIEHIDVRDTLARTIFIAQEAHEKHGSEALQRLLGDAQLPPIFLYTEAGDFKEPGAFRQALAAKLERRPSEPPSPVRAAGSGDRAARRSHAAAATVEPRRNPRSMSQRRKRPNPSSLCRKRPQPLNPHRKHPSTSSRCHKWPRASSQRRKPPRSTSPRRKRPSTSSPCPKRPPSVEPAPQAATSAQFVLQGPLIEAKPQPPPQRERPKAFR